MAQVQAITINGQNLPVREYEGLRVVTLSDISKVHNVKEKNIRNNFNNNRKHFIKGVDYYTLIGKEACYSMLNPHDKPHQNIGHALPITNLNIFTESGYLLLVKSLTDDLSWQIQRMLVNNYFNIKELKPALSNMQNILKFFPLLGKQYKQILYYRVEKELTRDETAKILEITAPTLRNKEMKLKEIGIYIPKHYKNQGKFASLEVHGE